MKAKLNKMPKMKCITIISQILEFGSYNEEYEFQIKGWNINKDFATVFIDSLLFEEGENLKVKDIIEIEEQCYSTSRYFEGENAKDEGFPGYVDFQEKECYKKGLGKCSNFKVRLERFDDS